VKAFWQIIKVVLIGRIVRNGNKLVGKVDLFEGANQIANERSLQEELLFHEIIDVLLNKLHNSWITDSCFLNDYLAVLFFLVDQQISIISILTLRVPVPVVNASVVKFDPASFALDDGVVMSSL
jgi:hypothetical protein